MENRRNQIRRRVDKRLIRRDRELCAVRRIAEALFQHVDTDRLVVNTLETAVTLINAECGSILLAEPNNECLIFRHSVGRCPVEPGTSIPWDQGIAGEVFRSGQVVLIPNVQHDPRHFSMIDRSTGYLTRDLIALPLKRWEGNAIGVLEVLNKREGGFNEDDVDVLSIVSAVAATTIEQARLFQEAKLAEVASILGNISHDINNLLMPVVCGTSVLSSAIHEAVTAGPNMTNERHRANYELCAEVTEIISTSTWRIQDRVKEIAECVKGRSSPPEFRMCSLRDIIGAVFATLTGIATEKQINLVDRGMDQLPCISADERRLFSAFYNLVHNALDEVPAGGSITITGLQLSPSCVQITVTDTGNGIPPDILKCLFTARTRSRKRGGTGLGTRIVKDVIESHHGKIGVTSKEGHGTTFIIDLPIVQSSLPDVSLPSPPIKSWA